MKPGKNKQPITKTTAQPHNPNGRQTSGSHPHGVPVQHGSASFYTALGRLLEAVIDRGTKGCIAHASVFRQAADLLLHPEAQAKSGVRLEVHNGSMWFLLALNHDGEAFHLQFADYHAPCGSYHLQNPKNPKVNPTTAAFVLFHIAAVLANPTVLEAKIITN